MTLAILIALALAVILVGIIRWDLKANPPKRKSDAR
jgi:hypothetical protein